MGNTVTGGTTKAQGFSNAILTYIHHRGKLSLIKKGVAPRELGTPRTPAQGNLSREASMAFTPYIVAFLALFSHQFLFWWLPVDSNDVPSRESAERGGPMT